MEKYESSKSNSPDYYFISIFYGLLMIVLISNIIAHYSSLNALTIGIILPIGISVITLAISFISYFFPQINISELFLNLFFYFSTGLILIFCDGNIFKLFYNNEDFESYMPSMLSLMILTLIGPKKLIRTRSLYLTTSFLLAILAFLLNLFGSQKTGISVFQFIILIINIIYNSQRCHGSKVSFSKSLFVRYREGKTSTGPKTVIEEIVDHIQSSSERMMDYYHMCDNEIKEKITQCINELSSAFKKLTTTKNIYETSIEALGKDMDIEDKQFIEQNFISTVSSAIMDAQPLKLFFFPSETPYGVDQIAGILKQISNE